MKDFLGLSIGISIIIIICVFLGFVLTPVETRAGNKDVAQVVFLSEFTYPKAKLPVVINRWLKQHPDKELLDIDFVDFGGVFSAAYITYK